MSADDIDAVVALLTDDAWLVMPPAPHEYHGSQAIAEFLRASTRWRAPRPLRLVPTRANTQPAFGGHLTHPDAPAVPAGILVLTLSGDRISTTARFLDHDLFRAFEVAEAAE